MRTTRPAAVAASAALTLLALTACGTSQPAAAPSSSAPSSSAAAGGVAVTDARGERITLDGPATRVVATEWNAVETLVSLGVTPVGVADTKGYAQYDTVAPIEGDTTDVGGRSEPSVDTVASLDPDLIVVPSEYEDSVIAQLERVAPVLVLTSGDAARPVEQMRDNVELIAEATGTEARAKTLLADFEAAIADGKQRLADAGLDGTRIAVADAYSEGDQVTIRPYTDGSLLGGVAEQLGLQDAWTVKGDAAYGLASTDVEGVTGLDADVRFVALTNAQDDDAFATLDDNAVWTSQPFVKGGHVVTIKDGFWPFGATVSATRFVDDLVTELTR